MEVNRLFYLCLQKLFILFPSVLSTRIKMQYFFPPYYLCRERLIGSVKINLSVLAQSSPYIADVAPTPSASSSRGKSFAARMSMSESAHFRETTSGNSLHGSGSESGKCCQFLCVSSEFLVLLDLKVWTFSCLCLTFLMIFDYRQLRQFDYPGQPLRMVRGGQEKLFLLLFGPFLR